MIIVPTTDLNSMRTGPDPMAMDPDPITTFVDPTAASEDPTSKFRMRFALFTLSSISYMVKWESLEDWKSKDWDQNFSRLLPGTKFSPHRYHKKWKTLVTRRRHHTLKCSSAELSTFAATWWWSEESSAAPQGQMKGLCVTSWVRVQGLTNKESQSCLNLKYIFFASCY